MPEKVKEEMQHVFNPEFLNRLDDVIVFHPLTEEHIAQIVGDPAQGRAEAAWPRRSSRSSSPTRPRSSWSKHGYDEKYGARPLKRAIQKFIEDPLSEKILLGEFAKGDEIEVDVVGRRHQARLPGADEHDQGLARSAVATADEAGRVAIAEWTRPASFMCILPMMRRFAFHRRRSAAVWRRGTSRTPGHRAPAAARLPIPSSFRGNSARPRCRRSAPRPGSCPAPR